MNAGLPEVFATTTHFTDADLTFFVQVHHDAEPLAWMLGHLRTHYPQARVIVRADGDDDPQLPGIARTFGAEFAADPWMFGLDRGGELIQRWFDLFLKRPTRWFLKIDTDTGIHRRFNSLPTHPGLFGSMQGNSCLVSIQGGFIGIPLAVATRLFESRVLLDPILQDPGRSWARDPNLFRYLQTKNSLFDDWILGYVATSLGIPMFGFTEVASTWKTYVPNPNQRFAITHPCKGMKL